MYIYIYRYIQCTNFSFIYILLKSFHNSDEFGFYSENMAVTGLSDSFIHDFLYIIFYMYLFRSDLFIPEL